MLRSLRVLALVMGFALIPLPLAHAALAAAASSLFEALPFLLAAALPVLGAQRPWLAALLGCGCGHGRSARSLPAALLGAVVLGPLIPTARLIAAWAIPNPSPQAHTTAADPLTALNAYLPYALAGGAVLTLVPAGTPEIATIPCPLALAAGAALAFIASPCAFGAITLGAALTHISPALATGWLTIAGIYDLRALHANSAHPQPIGKTSAIIIAAALTVVVIRHGATLINPRFLPLLLIAALIVACTVPQRPRSRNGIACAALMLLAALFASPPTPQPIAGATTLSAAYAGQPFTMIGQITHTHDATYITRQAITCCRADAAPITVKLLHAETQKESSWVTVSGTLVSNNNELALDPARISETSAPLDPYIYR